MTFGPYRYRLTVKTGRWFGRTRTYYADARFNWCDTNGDQIAASISVDLQEILRRAMYLCNCPSILSEVV